MDFFDSATNTLLIGENVNVTYHLYQISALSAQAVPSVGIELENQLRKEGLIASYDAEQDAIWYFQLAASDGKAASVIAELATKFDNSGQRLSLVEEGSIELSNLQRLLPQQQLKSNPMSPAVGQKILHLEPSQPFAGLSSVQEEVVGASDPLLPLSGPSANEPAVHATLSLYAYELFVSTMLRSLTMILCERLGALPLNHQTLLLSKAVNSPEDTSDVDQAVHKALAVLRVYLTTAGSLFLQVAVFPCGCLSNAKRDIIPDCPPRQPLLLAPFGVLSQWLLPTTDEPQSPDSAQTPNNVPALPSHDDVDAQPSLWKQTCLKILELEGIHSGLLSTKSWAYLYLPWEEIEQDIMELTGPPEPDAVSAFPWPSSLCFSKETIELPTTSCIGDVLLSVHEESHDPLSRARGWFKSSSDREDKIEKLKAERAAALKETAATSPDCLLSGTTAPSPEAVGRSGTVATTAIYPTPPEGAPFQTNVVTPSFDGTLSSPDESMPLTQTAETDAGDIGISILTDLYNGAATSRESSHHHGGGHAPVEGEFGEGEQLFGESEGAIFDENDITEADFNFFDDQPSTSDLSNLNTNNEMFFGPLTSDAITLHKSEREVNTHMARRSNTFTKPELKHARSSRHGVAGSPGRTAQSGSLKRGSSPFDPNTVFKRVRATVNINESPPHVLTSETNGVARVFERMSFSSILPAISKKYARGGQFDYEPLSTRDKPTDERDISLMTNLLPKVKHGSSESGVCHGDTATFFKTLTGIQRSATEPRSPGVEVTTFDGEGSGSSTDEDFSNYEDIDCISPSCVQTTIKAENDAMQAVPSEDVQMQEAPEPHILAEVRTLLKTRRPVPRLPDFFADPQPLEVELSMSDEDVIEVAQLVTAQAATGRLELNGTMERNEWNLSESPSSHRRRLFAQCKEVLQCLREIAPAITRETKSVSLKEYLDITEAPSVNQQSRFHPRPVPGRDANTDMLCSSNAFQIPCPHLEVRRAESRLLVLPSAVAFWESLGLGPSLGGKDVVATCVYPNWVGVLDNVKIFLGRLKSTYEALQLGSLDELQGSTDLHDGNSAYEMDRISTSPDATMTGHGSAILDSLEALRGSVCSMGSENINLVIFFVYPPSNPETILEGCAAFHQFAQSFSSCTDSPRETPHVELILQLIAVDTLSSPESMVFTPSSSLFRLCLETYDRCFLPDRSTRAPAIRLERPHTKIVDFKLTATPSPSLIRENSCVHMAYALSVDGRWLTAAWTDQRGTRQDLVSYCLRRKGRVQSRPVAEVAQHIWEALLQFISVHKVQWRVVVTKCGTIDQEEIDMWSRLSRNETHALVVLILLTADARPSLQILPPAVKLAEATSPSSPPMSASPAVAVSPEPSEAQATPTREGGVTPQTPSAEAAGEFEADSVLVDESDQAWGAILGHRLNTSASEMHLLPALASGFLIKKAGAKVEDPPVLLEINLAHTDVRSRAHELQLREMLDQFRQLGTLAKARGVVDGETDARPWHVAAAQKAVRALYLLM